MEKPLRPSPADPLLIRYMLGELNDAQKAEIDTWLNESPANRKYYEGFEYIWNETRSQGRSPAVDENAAWERFRERVTGNETPVRPLLSRTWFRFAAMITLLAGTGWLTYQWLGNTSAMITRQADSSVLTDTLPDGSVITLNQGATISYPSSFSQAGQRKVTLNGEAFFEVTPDKNKPFVIAVNEVTVSVLGTSFNIKETGERTEVIVETGQVKVETRSQEARVSPREKVTVEAGNLRKYHMDDTFHQFYRTGKLVCNDISLSKVIAKLGELYDVEIRLADSATGSLVINTTFEGNSLPDILNVISKTFNLRLDQDGNAIILKSR